MTSRVVGEGQSSTAARHCTCGWCQIETTRAEIDWVLAEMDRYGVNRGWVLACALKRAQRHERQPTKAGSS